MDLNSYYDSLKSKCGSGKNSNNSLNFYHVNTTTNSSGNKCKYIEQHCTYAGDSHENNNSLVFPIYTYNYSMPNPLYDWQIENYMEGSGSFGGVYKAKDLNTNKQYALKFINFYDESDYSYRIGINEAKILKRLAHCNQSNHIIRLFDNYVNEDQYNAKYLILALELCDCSLEDLISVRHECNSPWKTEEIYYLADEIVKSLLFLKQQSIAHQDMKPSNILLSVEESRYKLADFGFALQLQFNDDITQMTTNIGGTAIFMAPTLYNAQGNVATHNPFKSDVFSLGVALLHMAMPLLKREDIDNFHLDNYKQLLPDYYELLALMLTPEEKDRKNLEEIAQIIAQLPKLQPNDASFIDIVKTKKMTAGNLYEMYKKMIQLATAYEKIYKFGQTFYYYNKALEFAYNISEEEISNCYYLQGMILELLCDYPSSTDYLQKSLELRLKLYGKNHPALTDIYIILAYNYSRLGEHQKAIEAGQESLRIREQAQIPHDGYICSKYSFVQTKVKSQPKDLQLAQSYTAIGWVYHRDGKLTQALQNLNEAQNLIENVLGPDNCRMGTLLNNIGIVHYLTGQFDKSYDILRKSYKSHKKFSGAFHYETARSLTSLSQTHIKLSEYTRSKKYIERGLYIRLNAFGEMHLETTYSLDLLGVWHYHMGKYEDAKKFIQKAFDIRKKVLENQNSSDELPSILCNMGVTEHAIGNMQSAFQYYQEALKLDSCKKHSIRTGFILNNLANLQIEAKMLIDAEKNLLCFKEILSKSEVVNQFNYAIHFNNMGVLKAYTGNFVDAHASFKVAYDLLNTWFKQKSYYVAVAAANMAFIAMKLKEWASCLKYFAVCLKNYKDLFEFNHPDCIVIFFQLSRMLQTMEMDPSLMDDIDLILKKLEVGKEGLFKYLEKKREELRQGQSIGSKLEFIRVNLM